MRCFCVGGNERERESIKNLLFFYLLQYVFIFEREMKEKVCMWEW